MSETAVTPANGTPVSSPTGLPTAVGALLKSPYVAGVLAVAIAVAATLQGMIAAGQSMPKGVGVASAVMLGVATILGLYSPGARKAVVLLLVVGAALVLPSCSTLSAATKAGLTDCGKQALTAGINVALPKVGGILSGTQQDWAADLEQLALAEGPAVWCAVSVLVASIESGHQVPTADLGGAGIGPGPSVVPLSVVLSRARAVQAVHPTLGAP
jgi:hypothetical protein